MPLSYPFDTLIGAGGSRNVSTYARSVLRVVHLSPRKVH